MILNKQKGKKIGIFGLGLTGISSFRALKDLADTIVCWDDSEKNRDNFINEYGSKYIFGLSNNIWINLDKIIVSPGVAKSHKVFSLSKQYNILISSDIQLFLEENKNAKIIAVTGTNGKSTTTSLIGHILRQNGLNYHVGGNIGLPVLDLPQNTNNKEIEGYVLELSSFQLDLLNEFNPDIAVLLNITPDHLDRHGSFAEYCNAKFKAFKGDGIKIIGIDSKASAEFCNYLKSTNDKKVIAIGPHSSTYDISCSSELIIDKFFNMEQYKLPALNNLPGPHNQENIAASFAVCRSLGLMPSQIIHPVPNFKGLKHRMQNLGTKKGISYYNDSKATNATSSAYALASLDNIFWLAGGIFKEESLLPVAKELKNVKKAYLFGQSKMTFVDYLTDKIECELCQTMEEAFHKATTDALKASSGVNILLSPACSSFDQFNNFEDRGNQFIKLYDEK
jgi:UDP-N-acetylmuramoylalanine--D-glutamate ligase